MKNLEDWVLELEGKARLLRQTVVELEIDNKKHRAKNEEQEARIQLYKQKINDLNNKNQILKVSSELNRDTKEKGNPAAKKVVDRLIEEVDRCITLLDR